MDILGTLVDFVLHVDAHLGDIIAQYGTLTYALLFAIIFAETGLVVTPFLPGDSLLFAAGTFAALGALDLWVVMAILVLAAFLGDQVNYLIGRRIGPVAVERIDPRILRRDYMEMTEKFFARHGGKTIVLARFTPIVRTFAPFMAGVGGMHYPRFLAFNISSAFLWVVPFVVGGFVFGRVPVVREHFSLVVIGIVLLSVTPMVWGWLQHRRERAAEEAAAFGDADDDAGRAEATTAQAEVAD